MKKIEQIITEVEIHQLYECDVVIDIYEDKDFSHLLEGIPEFGNLKTPIVTWRNGRLEVVSGMSTVKATKSLGIEKINVCMMEIPEQKLRITKVVSKNVAKKTWREKGNEYLIAREYIGVRQGQRLEDGEDSLREAIRKLTGISGSDQQRLWVILKYEKENNVSLLSYCDDPESPIPLHQLAKALSDKEELNLPPPVKEVDLTPGCCPGCERPSPRIGVTTNWKLAFRDLIDQTDILC